ncbi:hypothetical protein HYU96_03050 [Candidatus Daviesbacteria bacterium]|nr:hypothetical protein [Candidatus Daviesbacteria bacterium]
MTKKKRAFLKALSAVTGNLSAAWFAVVLITPNFTNIFSIKTMGFLTQNIILGIVFLMLTAFIERKFVK